jgi:antitoxin component YwqK of YwqJK toxin-antitoxin module
MGPDPEREKKDPILCPAGTEVRPMTTVAPPEAGAACFKGATPHGPAITWDADGRLTSRGEHKEGNRHGRWVFWSKEGKRYLETDYADGVKEGLEINTPGGSRREQAFHNNEPTGAAAVYYQYGGKKKEEIIDLGDGATRQVTYRRSGEISYEFTYRGAALDGPMRELYPGGQPRCEGRYAANREDGLWTCWHSNGVKAREREYEGGALKRERQWDRGGALLGEIEYKGRKVGRVTGKPIRDDAASAFGG